MKITANSNQNRQSKVYEFFQNNPGGKTIHNDNLTDIVLIEAYSAEEANNKLEELGGDFDDNCPCCGYRWNRVDERDGVKEYKRILTVEKSATPSIFNQEVLIHLIGKERQKFYTKLGSGITKITDKTFTPNAPLNERECL